MVDCPPAGFRQIPGFPFYCIDGRGTVLSSGRSGRSGKGWLPISVHASKRNRRFFVVLWKENKQFYRRIHSLVLAAFVGDRPAGRECSHADNNRQNNNLANLSWETAESNRKNSGFFFGERNPNTTLRKEQVGEIRRATLFGATTKELSSRYGVTAQTIRNIIRNKTWKALPGGAAGLAA